MVRVLTVEWITMPTRISIKTKLIALLLACALIPLVVIAVVSFFSAKNALEADIRGQITSASRQSLGDVQSIINDAMIHVSAWARLNVMQETLIDDSDGTIRGYLENFSSQYVQFAELAVLNDRGIVIAATQADNLNQDYSQEPGVKDALTGHLHQDPVQLSKLTGAAGLTIYAPIAADYDAKTTIGVLVGVVSWAFVRDYLSTLTVFTGKQDGQAQFLLYDTASQSVLYKTGQARELEKLENGLSLDNAGEVTLHHVDGQPFLMSWFPSTSMKVMRDPGWQLAALVDEDYAYRSVMQLRNRTVVSGIILAAILGLIGYAGAQRLTKPIISITAAFKNIAEGEGDLRHRLDESGRDEVSELAHWFNVFVAKLQTIVHSIAENTARLRNETESVSISTRAAYEAVISQKEKTQDVGASMQQIATTVLSVAQNTNATASAAEQAAASSKAGEALVQSTVSCVDELASKVNATSEVIVNLVAEIKNISTVLEAIGSITEQVNLLALNASIEAARAGEHGRGFAVVANEVRTLAHRTMEQTRGITDTINRVQTRAGEAMDTAAATQQRAGATVMGAGSTQRNFAAIAATISNISAMSLNTAAAVEQQSLAIDQTKDHLLHIGDLAQHTEQLCENTENNIASLKEVADHLRGIVGEFKY